MHQRILSKMKPQRPRSQCLSSTSSCYYLSFSLSFKFPASLALPCLFSSSLLTSSQQEQGRNKLHKMYDRLPHGTHQNPISHKQMSYIRESGKDGERSCNKSQLVFCLPREQRLISARSGRQTNSSSFVFFYILKCGSHPSLPRAACVWCVYVCRKAWEWFNHKEQQEEPKRRRNAETRLSSNNDRLEAPPLPPSTY